MSDFVLLGPILLQGFEIPQSITWGGKQRLAIHNLPGGERVIDSLGRDDIDVSWSGIFTGADAALRVRTVDLMRAEGLVWPLSWSTYFYSVVIKSFTLDYTRSSWLPYRLSCAVLRDETATFITAGQSLAAQIQADLSSANSLATGIDLTTALAVASAPGAATLGTDANAKASTSLTEMNTDVDAAILAQQTSMLAETSGTAFGLIASTQSAGRLAALATARGYIRRAMANIQAAAT